MKIKDAEAVIKSCKESKIAMAEKYAKTSSNQKRHKDDASLKKKDVEDDIESDDGPVVPLPVHDSLI